MSWRTAVSRAIKILVTLIAGFVLLILLLSFSAKESVRVRILFDGHPVTALKCDPKYSKTQSQALRETVYSIPLRYGYNSSDESYTVTQFTIKQRAIFHVAKHIVPRM